jgi:hypothetical protein
MKQMKWFYWAGEIKNSLGKLNGLFWLNGQLVYMRGAGAWSH